MSEAEAGVRGPGAYVVLVSGRLREGQGPVFADIFKPLANYCEEHEQGTLSYMLSYAESDPDRLIILDRYISYEYLDKIHFKSDALQVFRQGVKENAIHWEKKVVHFYYETEHAHIKRKPFTGAFVRVATGKVAPGYAEVLKEIFRPLAQAAQQEEEALAYSLSFGDKEPDRFMIYRRYTSKEYLHKVHMHTEAWRAFEHGLKERMTWDEWPEAHEYKETDIGFMYR